MYRYRYLQCYVSILYLQCIETSNDDAFLLSLGGYIGWQKWSKSSHYVHRRIWYIKHPGGFVDLCVYLVLSLLDRISPRCLGYTLKYRCISPRYESGLSPRALIWSLLERSPKIPLLDLSPKRSASLLDITICSGNRYFLYRQKWSKNSHYLHRRNWYIKHPDGYVDMCVYLVISLLDRISPRCLGYI